MSFVPTSFRPLARGGFGGRAASHFRGMQQSDQYDVTGQTVINRGQVGTVVYRGIGAYANRQLAGFTRTSSEAVLPNCRVELFLTGADLAVAETISAGDGSFAFDNPGTGPFYIVAYRVGGGDVAGTTVNTLTASINGGQ